MFVCEEVGVIRWKEKLEQHTYSCSVEENLPTLDL